jgi:hypothetical protein
MKTFYRRGVIGVFLLLFSASTRAEQALEYKLVATTKTSTMEKELNEAGDAGFQLQTVMGGETAIGGKEAVAVLARAAGSKSRFQYKLLATNKTSTMQKEMQEAADAGFDYKGQTVFESLFGGKEVVVLMERDSAHPTRGDTYKLIATTKTSTMEKELQELGGEGYLALGMTVAKTAIGGKEVVTITRRRGGR